MKFEKICKHEVGNRENMTVMPILSATAYRISSSNSCADYLTYDGSCKHCGCFIKGIREDIPYELSSALRDFYIKQAKEMIS